MSGYKECVFYQKDTDTILIKKCYNPEWLAFLLDAEFLSEL